jgi:hypothetical protein
MARTVIAAFCCVAILVACVDDSIAARTVTVDDDYASLVDNDYLSAQPSTQRLLERELQFISPLGSISISLETPGCAVASVAVHFGSESPDVFPLIMQC